jgi:alpha/beta superfamily hydrolase
MSIKIHPIEFSADKVPSPEEVDFGISKLREIIKKDNVTLKEIERCYFQYIKLIPIVHMEFDLKNLENLPIFRARHSPDTINSINDFREPHKKNTPLGRCNWKKRPVFYGSWDIYSSLLETKRLSPDNKIFISKWMWKSKYKFPKLPSLRFLILLPTVQPEESVWNSLINSKDFSYFKKELGETKSEHYKYLTNQISNLFLEENKDIYPLTAFITNKSLYNSNNSKHGIYFGGLLYPSVLQNKKSINFAIHPLLVTNYMEFHSVHELKIQKLLINKNNSGVQTTQNAIGIETNNKIEWHFMQINENQSIYRIEKVVCINCDKTLTLSEIDLNSFQLNAKNIEVYDYCNDYLKNQNLLDISTIIHDLDAYKAIKVTHVTQQFENLTCISKDNETHNGIILNIALQYPIKYEKIIDSNILLSTKDPETSSW